MTDPCKDIVCIVLSDSDDEPAVKMPRREEKPTKITIALPVVADQDQQGTTGGNLDGSEKEVEKAVDTVQKEEQGVLVRVHSVHVDHSYAAAGGEETGDGPRIDDRGREVEQLQLQLQPAPAFSAQLLQQSIAAMKALRLPSRAGPARKTVITTRDVLVPRLTVTSDPINILQPCHPGTPKSISLDDAITQIRPHFYEGEHDGNFIFYCVRNATIGDSTILSLYCAVCRGSILKANVLAHFLAPEHIEKVRACRGAISLPAVQLWLRELQQAKAARAAEAAE